MIQEQIYILKQMSKFEIKLGDREIDKVLKGFSFIKIL